MVFFRKGKHLSKDKSKTTDKIGKETVAVSFAYLCFTPTERKSKEKYQKWFIVEAYNIY